MTVQTALVIIAGIMCVGVLMLAVGVGALVVGRRARR